MTLEADHEHTGEAAVQTATLQTLVAHRRDTGTGTRFASVYYDASHDTADAAKRLELTSRDVAERLRDAGCDDATVQRVTDAINDDTAPVGKSGRGLVAAGEKLFVDAELDEPPSQPIVRYGQSPYVIPLVRSAEPTVPHVVIKVDKIGAHVSGINRNGALVVQHEIRGTDHPVHEAGNRSGPPRRHSGEHVREIVRENMATVATDVTGLADDVDAELIVLSGEIKGRKRLREALPQRLRPLVADVTAGGRGHTENDGALDRQVATLVRDADQRHTDAVMDRFRQQSGRGDGLAVTGLDAVCEAVRDANVATLLVDPDAAHGVVHAGEDPIELATSADGLEQAGIPRAGLARADEAVPFAAVAIGSEVVAVDDAELADGVGALTRYR